MRTFASHVGDREYNVRRELFLDSQVPWLDVRPDSFVGDRNHRQREKGQRSFWASDVCVSINVGLRGGKHERSWAFQRFCVAFVAVGVLKKDAVPAANR